MGNIKWSSELQEKSTRKRRRRCCIASVSLAIGSAVATGIGLLVVWSMFGVTGPANLRPLRFAGCSVYSWIWVGLTLIWVFNHISHLTSHLCQIPISPGRFRQTMVLVLSKSHATPVPHPFQEQMGQPVQNCLKRFVIGCANDCYTHSTYRASFLGTFCNTDIFGWPSDDKAVTVGHINGENFTAADWERVISESEPINLAWERELR